MKTRWIVALTLLSLIFCFPARGDMGPKPEINIMVQNGPIGDYYLDLLIEGDHGEGLYQNLSNEKQYNQKLLESLKNNREPGWHLGIVDGTNVPMSGKLTGTPDGSGMMHKFGYLGVPDRFKIIVVTEDGKVKISNVYERHEFISNLIFDYQSGLVKPRTSLAVTYLIQFLTTCIPTLLLEGILLLLFGFSSKKNWITFLIVNLVTQVLLTGLAGSVLIKDGLLSAMILQVPLELMILIGETIAFSFFLRGHGKGRRICYGITANLCSWILGFFIMSFQFLLLQL